MPDGGGREHLEGHEREVRRLLMAVRSAKNSLEECLSDLCAEHEVASRVRRAASVALELIDALFGCVELGERLLPHLEERGEHALAERIKALEEDLKAVATALRPVLAKILEGRYPLDRSIRLVCEALEALLELEDKVEQWAEAVRKAGSRGVAGA